MLVPKMGGGMADVQALREIAERRSEGYVEALREMVNVDCGSYTPDGVNRVADLVAVVHPSGGR